MKIGGRFKDVEGRVKCKGRRKRGCRVWEYVYGVDRGYRYYC